MTLGKRIKKLRQMAGLTQEQLAEAIGYETKTSISKIENDKLDLNQSTVVALARVLKTTPSVIMGWSEIEEQTEEEKEQAARTSEFIKVFGKLTTEQQKMIIAQIKGILSDKT